MVAQKTSTNVLLKLPGTLSILILISQDFLLKSSNFNYLENPFCYRDAIEVLSWFYRSSLTKTEMLSRFYQCSLTRPKCYRTAIEMLSYTNFCRFAVFAFNRSKSFLYFQNSILCVGSGYDGYFFIENQTRRSKTTASFIESFFKLTFKNSTLTSREHSSLLSLRNSSALRPTPVFLVSPCSS